MELALLIVSIVSIVLLAACLCVCAVNLAVAKKRRSGIYSDAVGKSGEEDLLTALDTLNDNLNEVKNLINEHTTKEREILSNYITGVINSSNSGIAAMLEPYMKGFKETLGENLNTTKQALSEIRREMKESLKDVREDNKAQLESVQRSNSEQLERMRQTVDEKLNETLDKRIKNAFEMVNDSLSQVQRGFGEMKDLTAKVGNLNKMFANVKTRGGWGEVALESLLDQLLSPEQYRCQFRLDSKSREMVDFAIVMPGQGDKVYLPIDSKFPLDKYINLVELSESGDVERTEAARKELFNAVKDEAKDISRKYIITGVTTNFAVMYLPSEGLYAEIAKNSALTSQIQSEYRVTVCGPTTITALLNSLQMGFTTLKIQQRSSEIAKALQGFQKDFEKYTNLVSSIKKNANTMVDTIDKVEKRNGLITKRLAEINSDSPQGEGKLIASDIVTDDGSDGDIEEE